MHEAQFLETLTLNSVVSAEFVTALQHALNILTRRALNENFYGSEALCKNKIQAIEWAILFAKEHLKSTHTECSQPQPHSPPVQAGSEDLSRHQFL